MLDDEILGNVVMRFVFVVAFVTRARGVRLSDFIALVDRIKD